MKSQRVNCIVLPPDFARCLLRFHTVLPHFAVELRSDSVAIGLWARTDADGLVRMRLPLPGRWVLRGTELQPSVTRPGGWESRFVTLAFEVQHAGQHR